MAVGRVSFSLSGLGVLVFALGLSQCRPAGTPPPQSTEVLLPEASYRVRLGLLDEEPGIWSGRLVPVPGQKLELRPDEFRANIYRHSFLDSIHSVDADPQLPNDQIKGNSGWGAATRMSWIRGGKSVLRQPSLMVNILENPGEQPIRIETAKGAFRFSPGGIRPFQSETFLEGAVRVESVPPSSPLAARRVDIQDYPSLASTRSGTLWAAWQEYVEGEADLVLARSRDASGWGPVHLLDSDVDAFRTAVAEDSEGRVWVVWSGQMEGNWDLYARVFDGEEWSSRRRLTDHPSPDVYHRAVTDSEGRLWLIWQKTVDGVTQIVARDFDGEYWGEEVRISEGAAAGGKQLVAVGGRGSQWRPGRGLGRLRFRKLRRLSQTAAVGPVGGRPERGCDGSFRSRLLGGHGRQGTDLDRLARVGSAVGQGHGASRRSKRPVQGNGALRRPGHCGWLAWTTAVG